jgi:aspartate kinase
MKVFKFGGASVKNAEAVQNVAAILQLHKNEQLVVVVSAMDKTTNALEKLTNEYVKREDTHHILEEIKQYHYGVIAELFESKTHPVYDDINNTFVEIEWILEEEPLQEYDFIYDQIVSIGEMLSSKILSAYLKQCGMNSKWLDIRDCIKTDNTYREGKVDWDLTVASTLYALKATPTLVVTQGFIGVTSENFTTTLGREGSDYTAAIIAYCMDAESVTIWKDVPGVLNADPKWFDDTRKLEQLSYSDAIELAYYGATVIHPKTIKPLQNKDIPLYVKSFIQPAEQGTTVSKDSQTESLIPSFIFKVNQVLISISAKDFSFIIEENLSDIFATFAGMNIKMNLMQNSAISFSACIDFDEQKLPVLVEELRKNFKVLYNENLELVTIRHYDQTTIDRVLIDKEVLLEQKSRTTAQIVMKRV